ncbi:MAG: LptF/LptG family permease [Rickettsiales bacterium]|jgi:lipopolysaccharide export system permease protein|nr:LptF/LptG family permease [Rickettsiales bacterium]
MFRRNNFFSKTLAIYLAKDLLKTFFLLYLAVFFLVFMVDYIEFLSKGKNHIVPLLAGIKIVAYRTPRIMESLIQFLVLLSSAITLKKLSSRGELTAMYASGFSLWKITAVFSVLSLVIGFLNIFIVNPFFIKTSKISKKMELFHTKMESGEFVESPNGIWFEQINPKNNEKIILRTVKIYLDGMIFRDNIMLIFDENEKFLKKLSIEELTLYENFWLAKGVFTVEKGKPIKSAEKITILTNLKKDFVAQKIKNKYENINYMNIYQLAEFYDVFKKHKLDYGKFLAKINIELSFPFTLALMCMTAIIFITNTLRKNSALVEIFGATVAGVAIFIIQNTICELALANKISVFYVWRAVCFFFILAFIFLVQKIELNNL